MTRDGLPRNPADLARLHLSAMFAGPWNALDEPGRARVVAKVLSLGRPIATTCIALRHAHEGVIG